MKVLLSTLIFLFLSAAIPAQEAEAVIIYLTGKATYFEEGSQRSKAVYPGNRLAINGSLRAEGEGLVKLLYEGQTFVIRDNKIYRLSDLLQQTLGGSNIGFLNRFWSFLTSSMQASKDEKALEENHRRYMETVYAGVQGWATSSFALKGDRWCSGQLGPDTVTFRWKGMLPDQILRFRLLQNADENQLVLSAQLRDSAFSLDLSQLALTPLLRYEWEVLSTDDVAASPRSERLAFVYNPEGMAETLADLTAFQEYQEAAPIEQGLMQAFALERADFFKAALDVYRSLLLEHPQNQLSRDCYAAFLARMDDLGAAKVLLQNLPD